MFIKNLWYLRAVVVKLGTEVYSVVVEMILLHIAATVLPLLSAGPGKKENKGITFKKKKKRKKCSATAKARKVLFCSSAFVYLFCLSVQKIKEG